MKFENTRVFNFEGAVRGMRNPKNSWDASDSYFGLINYEYPEETDEMINKWLDAEKVEPELRDYEADLLKERLYEECVLQSFWNDTALVAYIGPKDMKLMRTLVKAGPEHRKFMRQIFVSVDITAPLYWWKEFDTYKVGTVANSTSTMHKIESKPIEFGDFEFDNDFIKEADGTVYDLKKGFESVVEMCEFYRQQYLRTRDSHWWKILIQALPESYLQTRTVTLNYENLLGICGKGQRRFHKLNEWSGEGSIFDPKNKPNFIRWARTLPYADELIFLDAVDKRESM